MRQPRYSDIFAGNDEGEAMAEVAKVLWVEYKRDLESRGLFNSSRGRILDRLVRASAEYQVYYPVAVADGPVRISPDGGQYVNMLWSQVRNLGDQISKLEKALTLTPESMGEKKSGSVNSGKVKAAADEFLVSH